MRRARQILAAAALLMTCALAHADPAPFDLTGPSLEISVRRGASTLPISQVPSLAPGDQLTIKADFPADQSAKYLMVAAFLSGSTNPPPPSWFFRCKTWTRSCAHDGLTVNVPQDAQQLLVFLAPKTSGDFSTVIDAVRGRPGAFVRASQDLNQAALDRSRLQAYLSAIRALDGEDASRLKDATALLARSLAVKVNAQCLERMPELQVPCLMQGADSLILNDGHSTSIVEALTSGPASDLAMEASFTPQLSYGYYSPYIASVLDIARILASFHTAQYQYIPALAALRGKQLALTLNAPPSFSDPKSVLVVALPAVEPPQPPPLHAVNPKDIYCASKNALVLPVEGAPLVFSTPYAHDLTLRLSASNGNSVELPVHADAEQGGLVVDTSALSGVSLGNAIHGSLHGQWGFDPYEGPSFRLVNSHPLSWQLASTEEPALIVGRQDTIHLTADAVSCVDDVILRDPSGKEIKPQWKAVKADEVELTLPLQAAHPGALTLLTTQYGAGQSQSVPLQAYAAPAHLDAFNLYAGDAQGVLKGSGLQNVSTLTMKGLEFVPGTLASHPNGDELAMIARDAGAAVVLKSGENVKAKVTLNDGRKLELAVQVGLPRPRVALIDKSVQPSASSGASNIHIDDPQELPQDATLVFSVRTQSPAEFRQDETIEVATADGASSTLLSVANGGLRLVNAHIAVATLDAANPLDVSAFGPLQFRVNSNGVSSDWQPLVTLVRLPVLTKLTCPATPELACKLTGSGLFLVDSISEDAQFTHPTRVPEGFPGYALPVPPPVDGQLYVKLRDDPLVANTIAMTAILLPPSPQEAARAAARLAATTRSDPPPGPEPASAVGASSSDSSTSNPVALPSPAAQDANAPAVQVETAAAVASPPSNPSPSGVAVPAVVAHSD